MSELNIGACSRPQHQRCVRMLDVQSWLSCALCGGYLIDATTISKCLHTCELLLFLFLFILATSQIFLEVILQRCCRRIRWSSKVKISSSMSNSNASSGNSVVVVVVVVSLSGMYCVSPSSPLCLSALQPHLEWLPASSPSQVTSTRCI